jgi:hypothetical protein
MEGVSKATGGAGATEEFQRSPLQIFLPIGEIFCSSEGWKISAGQGPSLRSGILTPDPRVWSSDWRRWRLTFQGKGYKPKASGCASFDVWRLTKYCELIPLTSCNWTFGKW